MNHTTAMIPARHRSSRAPARRINVALMIVVLAALMYYVIQVNAVAAHAWNMKDAQERLGILREERNTLIAQEAALDDRQALTELAVREGMVPVDTVVYLVQDHAVAAK